MYDKPVPSALASANMQILRLRGYAASLRMTAVGVCAPVEMTDDR